MSIYRMILIIALLTTYFAGCAHQQPVATPTETSASGGMTIAINPNTPEGIVALGRKLSAYRRSIYSVTQDNYTYYAGGELSAEFNASTRVLKVSSLLEGKPGLECEYTPQGILFIAPESKDRESYQTACAKLAQRLTDQLSQ